MLSVLKLLVKMTHCVSHQQQQYEWSPISYSVDLAHLGVIIAANFFDQLLFFSHYYFYLFLFIYLFFQKYNNNMQLLRSNFNEAELHGCAVDLSILTHYAEELVKFLSILGCSGQYEKNIHIEWTY